MGISGYPHPQIEPFHPSPYPPVRCRVSLESHVGCQDNAPARHWSESHPQCNSLLGKNILCPYTSDSFEACSTYRWDIANGIYHIEWDLTITCKCDYSILSYTFKWSCTWGLMGPHHCSQILLEANHRKLKTYDSNWKGQGATYRKPSICTCTCEVSEFGCTILCYTQFCGYFRG